MAIRFILLVSRQGKIRLTKWFTSDWTAKEKAKAVKDVSQTVLSRRTKMCNVLEYKDYKVVYRRYASLFFIAGTDIDDNELLTLEIIHRYVEVLDKWFLNVCELDIIFNFQQAYTIMDELLIGGELQESSKRSVINSLKRMEETEKAEQISNLL
ncbi:AP-2 complex subunit sigma [Chytriomyces sp. MP71]|nr:AP-2 complex subunit sigma [Chytriomyces sp. MP71]